MGKIEKFFKDTSTFLAEVKLELNNVTWPNKEETLGSTGVVLVAVLLIGVFIWLVDVVLQKAVTVVLKLV